jgi:hypothetical protein
MKTKRKLPDTFTVAVKLAMSDLENGDPDLAVKKLKKLIPTVSGTVGRLIYQAHEEAKIGSPERAETLLWMALREIGYPVSAVLADSSPENDERLLRGEPRPMEDLTNPVIVVSVSGGAVDAVYLNTRPIPVIVADFDTWKAGGDLCSEMQTEPLSNADDLVLENPLLKKLTTES